jgi:hypothetical protein
MAAAAADDLPIVRAARDAPRALSFSRTDTDFMTRYSTGGMKSVLNSHELKEERGCVTQRRLFPLF